MRGVKGGGALILAVGALAGVQAQSAQAKLTPGQTRLEEDRKKLYAVELEHDKDVVKFQTANAKEAAKVSAKAAKDREQAALDRRIAARSTTRSARAAERSAKRRSKSCARSRPPMKRRPRSWNSKPKKRNSKRRSRAQSAPRSLRRWSLKGLRSKRRSSKTKKPSKRKVSDTRARQSADAVGAGRADRGSLERMRRKRLLIVAALAAAMRRGRAAGRGGGRRPRWVHRLARGGR